MRILIICLLICNLTIAQSLRPLQEGLVLSTLLKVKDGSNKVECFLSLKNFKYDSMISLNNYKGFSKWSADSSNYETYWIDTRSEFYRIILSASSLNKTKINQTRLAISNNPIFSYLGKNDFFQISIKYSDIKKGLNPNASDIIFQSKLAISNNGLIFFYPPSIVKEGFEWDEILYDLLSEKIR